MTTRGSKIFTTIGTALILLFAATEFTRANSIDFSHPAFAATGRAPTSIPIGHAEFCQTHRNECGPNYNVVDAVELTETLWHQLVAVNSRFNTEIVPITDDQLYQTTEFWTYPDGYGDCEDFVLAKRRALIEMGWSPSTLLITVVRQQNGDGHAVLMVRTDRGDLVLDNQDALIQVWTNTPYLFVKRQSQANAAMWVDILDDPAVRLAQR